MPPQLLIRDTPEDLFTAAAEALVEAANQAVAERGVFHWALAGGATPEGLYRRLAGPEFADRLPWAAMEVWFGDERCVPPDHADSNYRMAREALLDHVPVPPPQVHRMPGEAPPHEAARRYAAQLCARLPLTEDRTPVLDLALIGLGGDGHIASLFPGTDALTATEPAVANWVPAQDAWRLTLTYPVLNAARRVWLLACGAGKADIVARANGAVEHPPLPVQRLAPQGEYLWLLESAAASRLRR
jgi:6-phosphogluconolactonase